MAGMMRRGRVRLAQARSRNAWLSMWSAADASLDLMLRPALARYATGVVLDVGCGQGPYRPLIAGSGLGYVGTDIQGPYEAVDVLADARALPFANETVGTVLCSEVLEHLSDPHVALSEAARVLQPGGHLVLSVPFLARIHEAPHDYFRFTKFALARLATDAGFELTELRECGSIFTFLAHQVSSLVVPPAFGLSMPFGRVVAILSGVILTAPAVLLDRIRGLAEVYPAGYLVVARKPVST